VTACRIDQIPDMKGICVTGQRIANVTLGGAGAVDNVNCGGGSNPPCASLDFTLHSRVIVGGNISIGGTTTLASDCDITNINILSLSGIQTVTVTKSVTLSYTGNSNSANTEISNVFFNITSSAMTNTFLLVSSQGYPSTKFNLTNINFNYKPGLNAPLISIGNINNVVLNGVTIERIPSSVVNDQMLVRRQRNADDSICASRTNNPGLLLTNVAGIFSNSTFRNINTGGVVVSGGRVTLDNVTFENNYVSRPLGFSNLRHNVFVTNAAEITITNGLQVDTGVSNFIYVAENGGAVVKSSTNDSFIPLFVPTLESAQPPSLNLNETTTTFAFTGTYLYPCGLFFNFYREGQDAQPTLIPLNVPDETTATASLLNELFSESGKYYGYFVYGPGLKYNTSKIELLGSSKESKSNPAGLIVGIVIAIVAVLAVLFVVIFFLAWRYRIQKRWSTESASERSGALAGESTKVFV
jgi:hypothetical protein